MEELKPCRACGDNRTHILRDQIGKLYFCSIGCLNILCDDEPVISVAFTEEKAERKARRKWNRRANDGN